MSRRFQYLLIPLILLIMVQPAVAEGYVPGYATKIISLFVIMGAYRILRDHKMIMWACLLLFVVAAVAVPTDEVTVSNTAHVVGALATVLALTMTALVISYEAIMEKWVTRDTLQGALVVYLLIGITATFVYEASEVIAPGSFTNLHGANSAQVFAELNYYSLVTLTTLGYGDISPVAPTVRVLATLEAILGQFFVAAIVGLLISRGGSQLSGTHPTVPQSTTRSNSQRQD